VSSQQILYIVIAAPVALVAGVQLKVRPLPTSASVRLTFIRKARGVARP
jgi:hypothetical protein